MLTRFGSSRQSILHLSSMHPAPQTHTHTHTQVRERAREKERETERGDRGREGGGVCVRVCERVSTCVMSCTSAATPTRSDPHTHNEVSEVHLHSLSLSRLTPHGPTPAHVQGREANLLSLSLSPGPSQKGSRQHSRTDTVGG